MRKCSHCGKPMKKGYCINGGMEYYCCDECLHAHISEEDYQEMYDNGDGDSYWTEWDDDDDPFNSQAFENNRPGRIPEEKIYRMELHLDKAQTKHPEFCTATTHKSAKILKQKLDAYRRLSEMHGTAEYILMEECYEALEAYAKKDKAQAIDECYDAIAVLLRLIDKLEEK